MNSDKIIAVTCEYQKLREEIQQRSNAQLYCVTVSIASLATVFGFILGNPTKYYPLLILIPWILTIFGVMWLDHSNRIFSIGDYIRDEIENHKLKELFGKSKTDWIGWENHLSGKRRWSFLVFFLPFFYFILPSIVAIVLFFIIAFTTITKMPTGIEWLLLVVAVFFIIVIFWKWITSFELTYR